MTERKVCYYDRVVNLPESNLPKVYLRLSCDVGGSLMKTSEYLQAIARSMVADGIRTMKGITDERR